MPENLVTLNDPTNIASRRSATGCRLLRFERWPFQNDHLVGHGDFDFSGWQINHVPVFRRKDGTLSAGVPSSAEVDRDGVQRRDADGRRKFSAMMGFSGNGKERWERTVLGALSDAGIVP